MSDTNRLNLAYEKESVFGTTVGTLFIDVPFTSESFRQDTNSARSKTIRSDRQIADLSRLGTSAQGELGFELQYGDYDEFIRAAVQSAAWSSPVVVDAADSTIAATAGTYVHSTAWAINPAVGDWIEVRGFATEGNNGYKKVSSASGTVITISAGSASMAIEALGSPITITAGGAVVNGVAQDSFSFEKEFTDLTNVFAVYTGMTCSGMSLDNSTDAQITGSFSFMGVAEVSATATAGSGSNTAVQGNEIYNNVDHTVAVYVSDIAQTITQFGFSLENNLRNRMVVGAAGPDSIGAGNIGITGTLRQYFETAIAMNKYLGFTTAPLSMVLEDSAGNAYVFDIPTMRFTGGQRVAGGENADILADMTFEASRDTTEDSTIRVVRFPA